MLSVVTLLWDFNQHSHTFSQMYDESWVRKLHAGFKRNLTKQFRFVLFTERKRDLPSEIVQEPIEGECSYSSCIQPYRMGVPMILVGLDTIVTGDCDEMARLAMTGSNIVLPTDPYDSTKVCNGVAIVPRGFDYIHGNWNGENDMEWMRKQRYVRSDFALPGQIVSYKGHVKQHGLGDARIVYFHGHEKPNELEDEWIKKHWNAED